MVSWDEGAESQPEELQGKKSWAMSQLLNRARRKKKKMDYRKKGGRDPKELWVKGRWAASGYAADRRIEACNIVKDIEMILLQRVATR